MITKRIYLDHNATTPMLSVVKDFYIEQIAKLSHFPLNPSSTHFYGQMARKYLNDARKSILETLNVDKSEFDFIFTSSGTESNHIVVNYFLQHGVSICSNLEHSSIYNNISNKMPCNDLGIPDLNYLKEFLDKTIKNTNKNILISVMQANNETGLILDLEEISKIAKYYGAFVHSDCSQSIGKIPFDFSDLKIDFATISSHKFGGPFGISGLIARKKTIFNILKGGDQEFGIRHGSENVIGAIVLDFAIKNAIKNQTNYYQHTSNLKKFLEKSIDDISLNNINAKKIQIIHQNLPRLPNTILLTLNSNFGSELLLTKFDLKGVAISSGSACSSGTKKPNYVLQNIFNHLNQVDSLRISLGISNTLDDIENFLKIFKTFFIEN